MFNLYKTECCLLTPALNVAETLEPSVLEIVQPKEQTYSYVKGLGKARNNLVKNSENPYLLFVDCGVSFSRSTFDSVIKKAVKNRGVVFYRGENGVLCTKVLGLPRWLFLKVGGFDESFHIGEDLEFGLRLFRLLKDNSVLDASLKFRTFIIPNNEVDHRKHEERGSYFDGLKVRVRCALRYRYWNFLVPQRKKDVGGMFLVPFLLAYYVFNNKRVDFCEAD